MCVCDDERDVCASVLTLLRDRDVCVCVCVCVRCRERDLVPHDPTSSSRPTLHRRRVRGIDRSSLARSRCCCCFPSLGPLARAVWSPVFRPHASSSSSSSSVAAAGADASWRPEVRDGPNERERGEDDGGAAAGTVRARGGGRRSAAASQGGGDAGRVRGEEGQAARVDPQPHAEGAAPRDGEAQGERARVDVGFRGGGGPAGLGRCWPRRRRGMEESTRPCTRRSSTTSASRQ